MTRQFGRARLILLLLVAIAVGAGGFVAWKIRARSPHPTSDDQFSLPPFSESRYLNTGTEAHYIGTAACAKCHRDNYLSYLHTAHSRSLAEVDPDAEPPDGAFDHQLSGRSYRVYRKDKQLRHEEVLRTAQGQDVTRVDLPVRYRIGSGHFTRTYLVEIDGFLHESPITWYSSRSKWDMSPGYDFADHWGFDRPVGASCVSCHAGRAEAVDGTLNRIAFQEQVIGCENCHGPGSLHAALRRSQNLAPKAEDLTIVNPARLPRPRLEAVCGACHLSGPATVALRGRTADDFRPGMPLTDYRIDYRFDGVEELMTVAGHMAQLRKSVCYQKRESLTCLTCHDPHAGDVPKNETAFYRQKCLGCHTVEACSLDQVQRLAKDPTDNCLICHMPRGATEFPHLAFTNHRILRNPVARPPGLAPGRALLPSDSSGQAPNLVPTDDNIQLSPLDRQRNLGLAYFEASGNPVYVRSGYAGAFHERALQLLEKVDAAGLADGETAGALANLYWEKDHALAAVYARKALQSSHLSAEARVSSLLKLAGMDMQDRQFEAAGRHLAEVVRLQRAAGDWYFLGLCYLQQNQPSQALPALQQSLSIRPDRSAVHARLAEAYRLLGDDQRATEHREKANWLFKEHGD